MMCMHENNALSMENFTHMHTVGVCITRFSGTNAVNHHQYLKVTV